MYYKGRQAALKNGDVFHLVAWDHKKGPYGINTTKRATSKYKKFYRNTGEFEHHIHAEVDLIMRLDRVPKRIFVARFKKDGTMSMARPCRYCQNFLRHKGVKKVVYSDWDGSWQEMML